MTRTLHADCGQPEFTPPGLVSLSLITAPVLGPPHMHLAAPADARYVGDLSPSGDPALYLAHIRSLYSWYCRHGAKAAVAAASQAAAGAVVGSGTPPPLVVNTHGWIKGMGFEVLVEMLAGLPVTHCIQIASGNPKKSLPPGAFWLPPQAQAHSPTLPLCWLLPPVTGAEAGAELQQEQPAASEVSNRSLEPAASEGGGGGARGRPALNAVEQRGLQWLAWAQQCVANCALSVAAGSGGGSGEGVEPGDALASALPFEVGLEGVEVQVLGGSLLPSQLWHALNGAVVGLCTVAAPEEQRQQQQQQQRQQQPSLPCLGLGLVRAADASCGALQLLTAVPEAELERTRVLQLGRLELPAALLQTPRFMSPYLSLFGMSTAGTGSGAIKSRGNLMRASQL